MARFEATFAYTGNVYTDGNTPTDHYLKYLQYIRNRIRQGFAGSSVVVSDIASWQGTSATFRGYAFVIKDGPDEWFIFTGYRGDSNTFQIGSIVGNNNATLVSKYFRTKTGTNATPTSGLAISYIYNCRKGSFGMGFNDLENLTYTAGDFQTPQYSPYSQIDSFMPQGMLKGLVDDIRHTNNMVDASVVQVVYDDYHKALLWVSSNSGNPCPSTLYFSGQMIADLGAGDEDRTFVGWLGLSWSANNSGNHSNAIAQAYNASGQSLDFTYDYTTPFTIRNYILPDGTVDFSSIKLVNPSYPKGFLKTELIRVQGPYNTSVGYANLFDGPNGPLIKMTSSFAVMYKEGIPPFPYDIGFDSRSFFE